MGAKIAFRVGIWVLALGWPVWGNAAEPTEAEFVPVAETGRAEFVPTKQESRVPKRYRQTKQEFPFETEYERSSGPVRIYKVRFPSPIKTEIEVNNTVHAQYFQPQGKGPFPAVIVLHILGGDFPLSQMIANGLARRGVAALFVKMPYYGERRPKTHRRRMLSPDLDETVAGMTQAVLDIRRAATWLEHRPEVDGEDMGVMGISLGGIMSGLSAAAEPRFKKVAMYLAGGNLHAAIWDSGLSELERSPGPMESRRRDPRNVHQEDGRGRSDHVRRPSEEPGRADGQRKKRRSHPPRMHRRLVEKNRHRPRDYLAGCGALFGGVVHRRRDGTPGAVFSTEFQTSGERKMTSSWQIRNFCKSLLPILLSCILLAQSSRIKAEDPTSDQVLKAVERGQRFLLRNQNEDGSWTIETHTVARFETGVTSLVLLALLESGMNLNDIPIKRALNYLRTGVKEPDPNLTYDVALMIMALKAVADGQKDLPRIRKLAGRLESAQKTKGDFEGSWGYTGRLREPWEGDRSNAEYAILGLHAAATAGAVVKRETWELAQKHWLKSQEKNGGWTYASPKGAAEPTGSMTAAGILSLLLIDEHLQTTSPQPKCCEPSESDEAVSKAVGWLNENYEPGRNPGTATGRERILYYFVALEHACRLSGQRYFGPRDWYLEEAKRLLDSQLGGRSQGAWKGSGQHEEDPVIGTSFAMLFLSRGLSPVLMQKLAYGDPEAKDAGKGSHWNQHPQGLQRLMEHISGLPQWPKRVIWQTSPLNQMVEDSSAEALRRAPILYISGDETYQFTKKEAELLRQYVDEGGTILGVATCSKEAENDFEKSFRELVQLMYPGGEFALRPLAKDHPVFQSPHRLDAAEFRLEGGNLKGRTAIYFSRDDLGCYWSMIANPQPKERSQKLADQVERMTQLGVNLATGVTSRKLRNKLDADASK